MAKKKELTKDDVKKFVAAYAKKRGISENAAKDQIMGTGVSRLKTLERAAAKAGSTPRAAKKAAKKTAKKAPAKKAKAAKAPAKKAGKAKKAPAKKAAKKPATKKAGSRPTVVEGEEA